MPKYKVGDRLKPQVSSNRITITGITEINYVVQYTQGANIGHEILWAIDEIDNSEVWTPYKEPRKTRTKYAVVLASDGNSNIFLSSLLFDIKDECRVEYTGNGYEIIDIIEINYEEKS